MFVSQIFHILAWYIHSSIKTKGLFVLFILSIKFNYLIAQTYRFQDAGINHKLPNKEVTKILQDKYGYMWFGTRNGLVKYDGINVEVFQFPILDSTRKDKNRPVVVTALSQSTKGDIWVGTANGEIARFDRINNKLTPFKIGPDNKDLYKPSHVIMEQHNEVMDKNLFTQQTTDSIFSQGQVLTIHPRDNGNLWVGNHNQSGFFKIETDTNTYHEKIAKVKKVTWYSDNNRTITIRGRAMHILEDKNGTLWMTGDRGIIEVHPNPFSYLLHALLPDKNHNWLNKFGEHIYLDSIIAISSAISGINVINLKTKKVSNYLESIQDSINRSNTNASVYFFSNPNNYLNGNLQVSPAKMLFFDKNSNKIWCRLKMFNNNKPRYVSFDPNTKKYEDLDIILDNGKNIEKNPFFEVVYQDLSGTIWATNHNGIYKVNSQSVAFNWIKNEENNERSLLGEQVSGIYKIDDENYWVATDKGLNLWDIKANLFQRYAYDKELFFDNAENWYKSLNTINDLLPITKDDVWLATNLNFQQFDRKHNRYSINKISLKYFNSHLTCYAIAKDKEENLWLGYKSRLCYFNPKTNRYTYYTFPGHHFLNFLSADITSLLIDNNDNLWIGTYDKGMFCLDLDQVPKDSEVIPLEAFESYEYEGAQPKLIDSKGNLWASTPASGIVKINLKSKEVKQYTEKDGLAHNNTFSLLEDNKGIIWVGTYNGLSRLDPNNDTFQNYYQTDGLPTNAITGNKALKTKEGILLFPTEKGILSFNPEQIHKNDIPPNIVLTSFQVDNQELKIGNDSPLKSDISLTKEITLPYWQNDLSISFAALHFDDAQKNQYEVFMENDDENWRNIGNQNTVEYTNMSPGSYNFKVRASNSDGVWNTTGISLAITILPPWWATWWAYTIYIAVIAGLLVAFYRYKINRNLQLAEAQRLQELDSFKTRFYTNITHEFRTPLTIILGLAKDAIIKRNASSLLQLVNQMLDLSKIESGALRVNMSQGNVIAYLKYLTESFHSLAENQQVSIHFISDLQEIKMDYDRDKIQHIVTNLLSNAVKFTPKGGEIYLLVDQIMADNQAYLQIKVKDTGIGISQDKITHIFDRFYQADETLLKNDTGTGLGLAVSKELVLLLNGKIEAKSKLGTGTEITIQLPITQTASFVEEKFESVEPQEYNIDVIEEEPLDEEEMNHQTNMPLVLIVEDSDDVIYYLKSCLKYDYKIETASNGQEGINKAKVIVPDIIISDVMMPIKDGYMLCEELKTDILTSHIPIILLTAKVMTENRIEGLEVGADAYLTKPFDEIELEACIKNLMKQRERLWKSYKSNKVDDVSVKGMSIQDQKFLEKAHKILEEYKSDSDFNGEKLLRELGVSRTFLHVKLKALTGKSTTEFIRTYRLKYAAELIKNGYGNLTEISIETGFANQSYFSKAFKDYYGVSPSAFAKEKS